MCKSAAAILVICCCFAAGLEANSPQVLTPGRTVWNGVYTADQAERGLAAYTANCAGCHKNDLEGDHIEAPALKGDAFMERWRDYSLRPLVDMIRTEMPPLRFRTPDTRPLSDNTYIDILTYILRGNTFPAGSSELTLDMLEKVQLVGQYGASPPPNYSLVLSVGCFSQTPESRWMLVDATHPIRTTMADMTTPKELEASQSMPLGPREFRVMDFGYLGETFSPEAYRGHKLQIKGYLIRQREFERIIPTSLERLATSCDK